MDCDVEVATTDKLVSAAALVCVFVDCASVWLREGPVTGSEVAVELVDSAACVELVSTAELVAPAPEELASEAED